MGYFETIVDPEEGEATPASLQKFTEDLILDPSFALKGRVPKW